MQRHVLSAGDTQPQVHPCLRSLACPEQWLYRQPAFRGGEGTADNRNWGRLACFEFLCVLGYRKDGRLIIALQLLILQPGSLRVNEAPWERKGQAMPGVIDAGSAGGEEGGHTNSGPWAESSTTTESLLGMLRAILLFHFVVNYHRKQLYLYILSSDKSLTLSWRLIIFQLG